MVKNINIFIKKDYNLSLFTFSSETTSQYMSKILKGSIGIIVKLQLF